MTDLRVTLNWLHIKHHRNIEICTFNLFERYIFFLWEILYIFFLFQIKCVQKKKLFKINHEILSYFFPILRRSLRFSSFQKFGIIPVAYRFIKIIVGRTSYCLLYKLIESMYINTTQIYYPGFLGHPVRTVASYEHFTCL